MEKVGKEMGSILEILEATASRYPDNIAAEDAETSCTYRELTEKAKKAGSFLARRVKKGDPVVLFLEKSAATLAVMYGVVYSGSFYVFVSPEQPEERIMRILKRLEARIVVTTEDLSGKMKEAGFDGELYLTGDLLNGPEETDPALLKKIRDQADRDDLLYGIFTSGSTGEPKGVVVSHGACEDFIGHFTQEFGILPTDRIGNQAPFDFDVSIKDIYSCAFTGAALVMIPRTCFAAPRDLLDFLCDRHITVLIWAVSAICIISMFRGFEYRVPTDLRFVMFSGETMPVKHLAAWQRALPDAQFVNLYGPTEITCNCTFYKVPHGVFEGTEIPAGIPFAGRVVRLLDENNKEIHETGVEGQIAVSGESLASGYYHDPERTAQSFVQLGQRTYLTGDLGAMGEDGLLYFHGRSDNQIKHMGHRIELGEIESAMMEIPGVERGCCIYDPQRSRIFGFYSGTPDQKELRTRLKEILPAYMIPNRIRQVEHFRLNKNGKIDRTYLKQEAGII